MSSIDLKASQARQPKSLCAILSAAAILVAGCTHKEDFKFKPGDTTSYAAPQLEPALSASDQATGVEVVKQYIADIDRKDYAGAEKALTPSLQATCPQTTLAHQVTSEGFWTKLPGSRDWGFDLVQGQRHGSEMIVHTHFTAADAILYKMNFILRKTGSDWLINQMSYPVQKTTLQLGGLGTAPTQSKSHK
jgi:hypothetical protein